MRPLPIIRGLAIAVAAALPLAAAPAAAATITPLEQERSISANVTGTDVSRSATAFEPWSEVIDLENFDGSVRASASQTSSIGLRRIDASGGASVVDTGRGGSVFDLRFSIDEGAAYRIDAFMSGAGIFETGILILEDASGSRLHDTGGFSGAFAYEGVLTAGTYRLRAGAGHSSIGDGGGRGSSYQFAFVIPEPASAALLALGLTTLAGRRRHAGARRA